MKQSTENCLEQIEKLKKELAQADDSGESGGGVLLRE
jgi:hypothetical protein